MREIVPYFSGTYEQAEKAGLTDWWRWSRQEDAACLDCIAEGCGKGVLGILTGLPDTLVERFGAERAIGVLAPYLGAGEYDGSVGRLSWERARKECGGRPPERPLDADPHLLAAIWSALMTAEYAQEKLEQQRCSQGMGGTACG